MILHSYLRSLSATEKKVLAHETGISLGYMRNLHGNPRLIASIELAEKILKSQVNKNLPANYRLTAEDVAKHREEFNTRKEAK